MKRTTLLSLLTMLLLFVGSNVWAQDEPFYTLWTVSAEGTNHTNYTQYFDDEHDGMTWNAPGNQKVSNDITDRWRIGGKEIENVDRTITAKTPMGSAIDRVVLNHFGTSRSAVTVNSLILTVASDVNYADIIDEVVLTPEIATGEAGSEEFVPTAESLTEWPVDAYYRLTINLTNTTKSNGGLDIASIQFFAPGGGSTVTVAKPVITPNGGTFAEAQEVTITADAGCTIYYTTDGTGPTSESTEYTAPFTVSENCIVKAIAYDADDNASSIASAEFTFTNPADAIETIAELCAATPASGTEQVLVNFNDWVVTGLRGKNNVNVLFTDGNNGILLYQSNHGFNVGDHITGSATINLTTYKGAPEITGLTATTEGVTVTAGEEAAPVASTIANLDNTKQGCVVVLEGLTYNATDQVLTDANGASIAFYDGFSTGFTPEDGKTYDVTGIVLWFDKLQIAPRTANDFVEAGGVVTVAQPVITPAGGTFAEPQTVTITAGEGCTIYYTTDSTEPTEASTLYEAPFTVSETCTVKAIAYDEDDNASSIASADFTFASVITTIAELCEATPASGSIPVTVQFNDWIVTGVKGKNAYFTDGTNGILLYQDGHAFEVGDKLTGTATFNLTTYKNAPEITGLKSTTEGVTIAEKGADVAPIATTIGELEKNMQGCVIQLTELTYEGGVFKDASGAEITPYNTFGITMPTLEEGKVYNATGVAVWFDKWEIAPRATTDIQEANVLVAAPVITPAGGTFAEAQEVTITAEEGNTIYYTLDGTDPTDASTPYTAPFTVSEDCTVKAVAYDADDNASSITSAEFKFISVLTFSTIADLCAAAPAEGDVEVSVEFNNWIVTGVKGGQVFFTDGANGIVAYKSQHGFKLGDVLTGSAVVTLTLYNECAEITSLTATTAGVTVTEGTGATPMNVVISDLEKDMQGCLLSFEGLTYDGSAFVDDDDNTIVPSNKFTTLPELMEGKTYNVTGVAVWYVPSGQSGHWEIAPRTAEEIVLVTTQIAPESSWSVEEEVVDINGASTAVFTTNSDGAVTYDSSDEQVATISEEGVITLVGQGVTTITANVAETETYLPDSKSFKLTVTKEGYAEATFAFGDTDIQGQGTSGGGSGFSATRNDVLTLSFTNAYGAAQHIKVYGNGANDIEYSNVELSVVDGYAISQIVFTITGDQDNRSVWVDQFGAEAAYSEDSLNVTWAGMQNKVILNNLYNTKTLRPKQARIKTIDVTYIKLNETGKTITIGETGLATFCGAEKCVLSGAEQFAIAGAITGAEGRVLTVDTLTSSIPAEVGVLLMGAPGEYKVYTHPDLVEEVPEVNLLTGVLEDTAAPVGSYVLQEQEAVGFFEVVAKDPITVPAGHAYLTIEGATAPAFFFTQEDYETGINKVVAETNDAIYNLAGQRLSKMQKGINIVGGKKVLK